jgi:hypothetical protein
LTRKNLTFSERQIPAIAAAVAVVVTVTLEEDDRALGARYGHPGQRRFVSSFDDFFMFNGPSVTVPAYVERECGQKVRAPVVMVPASSKTPNILCHIIIIHRDAAGSWFRVSEFQIQFFRTTLQ